LGFGIRKYRIWSLFGDSDFESLVWGFRVRDFMSCSLGERFWALRNLGLNSKVSTLGVELCVLDFRFEGIVVKNKDSGFRV
jgi:hypothetical protein